MDTKCAPSMTIISMGKLESEYLSKRHLVPLVWWRYIDDILMIWPYSIEELNSLVNPTIKFTYNYNQTHVNFLDVLVTKDKNGNLETALYTKPTDAHMFLNYDSFHPVQQQKSIPYSQAVRLPSICRTQERYWEAAEMLYQNLSGRGYSKTMVTL